MTSPRKPGRLGLYIPFALLLLAAVAWTVFWLWSRGEARSRMDAAADSLRQAGYEVSWGERALGGYPFRLNVALRDVRLRDPSGWALQAPRLEAEAYMHAPGHWMIAAPDGAVFVRPVGGPVTVRGKLVRASLGQLRKRPPSFSFEGVDLSFQPAAGAAPFALAAAGRVEFHLRAGPEDEGGVFVQVQNGVARPETALGRIAGDKPVSLEWNSTLSRMSTLEGADWSAAVRQWSQGGGAMNIRRVAFTAGEAALTADKGRLTADSGGRLSGVLDVSLRRAPQALVALAQAGAISPEAAAAATLVVLARQGAGDSARATINFQAGQTTLGPVALAPAPKVYAVR